MDKQLWQRAQSVFDVMVALSLNQRQSRLDELCQGDAQLSSEVTSLLQAYDAATAWTQADEQSRIDPGNDISGQCVNGYVIGHRMAQGGMGAVYFAERDVDGVAQAVAIKLVHLGMNSEQVLRRFTRERRILAALRHRHICPILDAGVMLDGRPYLVMPYIEHGRSLSQYCRDETLSLSARLELFSKLCDAVHHAHQRLVVHADIKPDNILITPDGEPMLLDFGVARLLAPEVLGDDTTAFVEEASRPFTPRYASPEQLAGQAPGTGSDIYSLGLVLWELLSCRVPDRSQELSLPSSSVDAESQGVPISTTRWVRQLRGDLDIICGKALRESESERYVSAAALGEDVHRFVTGLPIQARRPSLRYQLGRYIRRHPVLSAASATATLLLAAILAIVLQLNGQIRVHADEAVLERNRAEAIAEFWAKLFRETDPMTAPDADAALSATDLLDRAMAQLQDNRELLPRSRARLLTVVSEAYWGLAETDKSVAAVRKAVELHAEQPLIATEFVDAYRHLANVLGSLQQADESLLMAQLALEQLEQLPAPDPRRRSMILNAMALAVDEQGQLDEAARYLGQAVQIQRDLGDETVDIATNIGNLAYVYYRLARGADSQIEKSSMLDQSQALLDEAINRMTAILGAEHPRVGVLVNGAGRIAGERGNIEQSVNYYQSALKSTQANLPPAHEMVLHTRINLAHARMQSGDEAAALAQYEELIRVAGEAYPSGYSLLLQSYLGRARVLAQRGAYDAARQDLSHVLAVAASKEGEKVTENAVNSLWAQALEARIRVLENQFQEATVLLDELDQAIALEAFVPADLIKHLQISRKKLTET